LKFGEATKVFSGVIASAMSRAKIGIIPQLAISIIESQFPVKNFIGKYFDRHDMVNMRDLAVIG
jgi:hypothetical protein